MIDTLPLAPAPGYADVQGSRHLFTPPGAAAVPLLPATGADWRAEPTADGRAILRDAAGQSWGVFASPATCAQTAARLSR